jgi:hypothetical protein
MIQISVTTRQLKIWYALDELSADAIADLIKENNPEANVTGDDVAKLIKDRKIQSRNIRRSEPNFVFLDPENEDLTVSNAEVIQAIEEGENVQVTSENAMEAGFPGNAPEEPVVLESFAVTNTEESLI